MRPLSIGSEGEGARTLQLLLTMTAVAAPGAADGIFGPLTLAAVQRARKALGLAPGDQADEELLDRLRGLPRRPKLIRRVRTPTTVEELLLALERGYEAVFARTPNPLAVRVSCAQLQQEHGAAPRAIWVNNLGNQDALSPWKGPVFYLRGPEVLDGERKFLTKALRAYASLDEGAEGYWRRLVEGYTSALPFFEAGDPAGAAKELKSLSYFTGDLDDYRRGMVDRFKALAAVGV